MKSTGVDAENVEIVDYHQENLMPHTPIHPGEHLAEDFSNSA